MPLTFTLAPALAPAPTIRKFVFHWRAWWVNRTLLKAQTYVVSAIERGGLQVNLYEDPVFHRAQERLQGNGLYAGDRFEVQRAPGRIQRWQIARTAGLERLFTPSDGIFRDAEVSDDGLYRYTLSRAWHQASRRVVFVGLNPSTADGTVDDPTIRRCVSFARYWGYGSLTMLNLYAYRSTDPDALLEVADPVGAANDFVLSVAAEAVRLQGGLVVCCWGAHKMATPARVTRVRGRLGEPLHHLGLTKDGAPRHPLYLRADTPPMQWPC